MAPALFYAPVDTRCSACPRFFLHRSTRGLRCYRYWGGILVSCSRRHVDERTPTRREGIAMPEFSRRHLIEAAAAGGAIATAATTGASSQSQPQWGPTP